MKASVKKALEDRRSQRWRRLQTLGYFVARQRETLQDLIKETRRVAREVAELDKALGRKLEKVK